MKRIIEEVTTKYGKRRRVAIQFNEPSLADGSQKDDTDINKIVKQFIKTRDPSLLQVRQGMYADVSQLGDLTKAYEDIAAAEAAFNTVPAELREKLKNDPKEFIKFLADPSNDEEAIKYGVKSRIKKDPPLPTAPEEQKPTTPVTES